MSRSATPRRSRRPRRCWRARARQRAGPTCRCCGSPQAHLLHRRRRANCSTAPARAASTCSSSPAARSTARATSIWSASATTTHPKVRFPGSFGSAYLYFVVPKVILFRTEHSRRTLVPKVDFISAPGGSDDNVYRTGGPIALITNRCLFSLRPDARRFRLASVHPGHTVAEVIENTGFEFDRPADVPVTPAPSRRDAAADAPGGGAGARRGLSAVRRQGVRGRQAAPLIRPVIADAPARRHGLYARPPGPKSNANKGNVR